MNGPGLIIRGAILGSLLVLLVTICSTANLASAALPSPAESIANPPSQASQTEKTGKQKKQPKKKNQVKKVSTKPNKGKTCQISNEYPASIMQWCDLVTAYARKRDLPPDLVAAVMLQESGGNHQAYSHSGAVGLLQVMPRDGLAAAFICANGPCFAKRPSMDELYDPEFNIEYGTGMLANLYAKYGNYRETLRAYGPGDAGYTYADKVLAIYERYGD